MKIEPVRTYADFNSSCGAQVRLRNLARDAAVLGLSVGRSIGRTSGWVRFPYYHHVFDDERQGFSNQLDYLKTFGDFISLDEVVSLVESGDTIDGRYFCLTFDDGFKNCLTNALPILIEKKAIAAFYVTTGYIGLDPLQDQDKLLGFFDSGQVLMEFLNWDDCRELADAGMTLGSHTVNHARLADLDEDNVRQELAQSKALIEEQLGLPCHHFCSPFGIPGKDFVIERDPKLAESAGYRSMSTTERGATRHGSSPFWLRRDHTLANWGNHQLRYFMSL